MSADNNEECWGCSLYNKKRDYCYEFTAPIETCPCRQCVVKFICQNHCDKIDPFITIAAENIEY